MFFFKRKPRGPEIWDFPDLDALIRSGAAFVREMAHLAVRQRGCCNVCISASPEVLQLCAALPFGPQHAAIDWSRLHVFWAWERSLSAEDCAESALQRTKRALRNTQLPGVNLHPIPMEHGTARAVAGYEHELERHFQQSASIEPPPWDILLIDVGADGGLGGLLPGDPALNKPTRWAAALSHGGVGLTLRALEGARNALLLAAGPDKHSIAARARTPDPAFKELPAGCFTPMGRRIWLTAT